jgi:hypothetical protein
MVGCILIREIDDVIDFGDFARKDRENSELKAENSELMSENFELKGLLADSVNEISLLKERLARFENSSPEPEPGGK